MPTLRIVGTENERVDIEKGKKKEEVGLKMEREGGRTEKKKKKSISLVKTRQELFREEGVQVT